MRTYFTKTNYYPDVWKRWRVIHKEIKTPGENPDVELSRRALFSWPSLVGSVMDMRSISFTFASFHQATLVTAMRVYSMHRVLASKGSYAYTKKSYVRSST